MLLVSHDRKNTNNSLFIAIKLRLNNRTNDWNAGLQDMAYKNDTVPILSGCLVTLIVFQILTSGNKKKNTYIYAVKFFTLKVHWVISCSECSFCSNVKLLWNCRDKDHCFVVYCISREKKILFLQLRWKVIFLRPCHPICFVCWDACQLLERLSDIVSPQGLKLRFE